jgi:hypothetical protein
VINRATLLLSVNVLASHACGEELDISGEAVGTNEVTGEAGRPNDSPSAGSSLWVQSFDAPGITDVASAHDGSAFIARAGVEMLALDPSGAPRWSKPYGSRVATNGDDVWVAGTFTGEMMLDPAGSSVLHAAGGRDVYVARLRATGELVYGVALGGAADEELRSLAVDANGNAIASGPGLGTVKLAADGSTLWQRAFFGEAAFDPLGNVLLTGALSEDVDFGAGALRSQGGSDVFVVKLGLDGEHVFSRSFGDAGSLQQGEGVAADAAGNVLITGTFDGRLELGSSEHSLEWHPCSSDAWCVTFGFVMKLDPLGSPLWGVSRGPMRTLPGVATDAGGNIAISGTLPGGVRPFKLTSLAQLDPDGEQLWQLSEWPDTGIGDGGRIASVQPHDLLWAVDALPTLDTDARPHLARIVAADGD